MSVPAESGRDPDRDKDVAFYAAAVDAWLTTGMEKDRTLLALAAGGLAVLASLLSAKGLIGAGQAGLYIVAVFAFLVTILAVLWVLERNKKVLKDAIEGGDGKDRLMEALDVVAMVTFLFGVLATLLIAATYAQHDLVRLGEEKGQKTMEKTDVRAGREFTRVEPGGEKRGLSGVGALRPPVVPADPADTGGGDAGGGGAATGSQGGGTGGQVESGKEGN